MKLSSQVSQVDTNVAINELKEHIDTLCIDNRRPRSTGYKRTQEFLTDFIVSCGHEAQIQTFFAIPFGQCKNIYAEVGYTSSVQPRILVGAHYDTRGSSGPGADDNASAVAIVMALLARAKTDIPMTFVFFDYEETFGYGGTKGSRAFAAQYDKPLSKAIILDLVGGALMPGFEDVYFQFGPALPCLQSKHLDIHHLPMLFVEPVGTCVPRSDYGRFRNIGVPFTFISSGTPWYYHTASDVPEMLHFEKMAHLLDCLQKSMSSSSSVMHEPSWARFQEIVDKIRAVPAFDDAFFHRLASTGSAPSRLDMLHMYFKVLPALKRLGPDLWD